LKIEEIYATINDACTSDTICVRTKNTITIISGLEDRRVQIILRIFKSVLISIAYVLRTMVKMSMLHHEQLRPLLANAIPSIFHYDHIHTRTVLRSTGAEELRLIGPC
jgi:hypothetical protein